LFYSILTYLLAYLIVFVPALQMGVSAPDDSRHQRERRRRETWRPIRRTSPSHRRYRLR